MFFTDVFVPADRLVGTEGRGWTVAGSTLAHERGTSFPFKEQVVHEAYLSRLYEEAACRRRLDDPMVADALAAAWVELGVLRLHNLRTLTRLGRGEEPGPESSWVKLTWTAMTQHMAEARLLVTGRATGSGLSGPWARQWLWSGAASIAGGPRRSSATSSPGASWACPGGNGTSEHSTRHGGRAGGRRPATTPGVGPPPVPRVGGAAQRAVGSRRRYTLREVFGLGKVKNGVTGRALVQSAGTAPWGAGVEGWQPYRVKKRFLVSTSKWPDRARPSR